MRTREISKETRSISLWLGILLLFIASSVIPALAVTETLTYDYYDTAAIKKATYGDRASIEYVYDAMGNRTSMTVTLHPEISVSPASLSFGNTNVGTSPSLTVTVTNVGTGSLIIDAISITGPNAARFSQSNDCSTLAPSGTCSIDVTFLPTTAGYKSATLSISSNDPDMPTLDVDLTGTGGSVLTVAVNPASCGTVTGTGISCPGDCIENFNTPDASDQLTAAPGTGYHFVNWSGDMNSANNPETVTMDVNKSVTANFSINTYTITATAGSNGSISPSGDVPLNYGDNLTFIITPNPSCCVVDVLVDSASAGAVLSYPFVNVTANHTITASFTYPVKRISGLSTYDYSTLQDAYDAAVEGDVIETVAAELTGDLTAGDSKTVTIQGGYDCGFASVVGMTSLKGNLMITNGKVTAKDIHVKQ